MVAIANMQMPENCQTCPFLYAGIDAACCLAKARYEATLDGKWGVNAPIITDSNCGPQDSFCPLYDDAMLDDALKNALEEIARLRGEVARLTGAYSTAAP